MTKRVDSKLQKEKLLRKMIEIGDKTINKTMDFINNTGKYPLIAIGSIVTMTRGFAMHNSMDATSSLERLKSSFNQLQLLETYTKAGLAILLRTYMGNSITENNNKDRYLVSKKTQRENNVIKGVIDLSILGLLGVMGNARVGSIDSDVITTLQNSDVVSQFEQIKSFIMNNPDKMGETIKFLKGSGVDAEVIKETFDKISTAIQNKEEAVQFVNQNISSEIGNN